MTKRTLIFYFVSLFFCIGNVYAEGDKKVIPKNNKWEETNYRDISCQQLYQSESSVYVYYEKQLDNVTIGNRFSKKSLQ